MPDNKTAKKIPQNQELINLITKRQSKLQTDKSNFEDRFEDIADYVSPHREDIRDTLVKGEKKGNKIFDGTAVSAAVLATDGIHGYHVSPAFDWFKYSMNRKQVNKVLEIREWLDEIEFNMYTALNRSNFYSEMWSFIYDGFTMGTSSIYPEEDLAEERIVFETIHPGEFYMAENKYGEIDVLHRKKKITARKLVQMFGEENLPEKIKNSHRDQPFGEHEVIHAVFPREEFNDRMKDVGNKRFASVWMITEGNTIARISGFDEFPYHSWRYMKTGKEVYGVSPAMLSMADIKGLNIMDKTLLGAAQMALDPPLNVPAYLAGQVQWKPRGLNYLKDMNDRITPANTGVNYPVGTDMQARKQAQIKERFHVDTFLLLTQMAGQGTRTATEVNELMAEKAAVLGAELGPFNKQIDSILDHVYSIETNAGRMPSPPDILLEMAEEDKAIRFDPVYQGPLAKAQQDRFGKDPFRKFFVDIAPVLELDPDALDNFDLDATARLLGEDLPSEVINSLDKVTKIREGKAQAQAEQEQEEAMAAGVEGMKTMSEADKNLNGRMSAELGGAVAP
ncbi:head-tail connector protein [Candidatus Pacearchaeota archaeon]|nr:head-tail connector protein [Candidatus Pacearchaeota archaeon]